MYKFKHLNLDERYVIQHGLDAGKPFKAIGREIRRDCRTISREVSAYATVTKTGGSGRCFNNCLNRYNCSVTKLKTGCSRKKRCSLCFECCRTVCSEYSTQTCHTLLNAPYCCNNCPRKQQCTLSKMIYRAVKADKIYRENRSDANRGIYADPEEIERINRIISPLISKGQSLHHICVNHSDELMLSEKTLYSYAAMGFFDAKNIDMPRKVRYKSRKRSHSVFKVDKKCRIGRTYEDMLRFIDENGDIGAVEMDSVIGRKGGKVLLTFFFTSTHIMLAFIRDSNTALSVKNVFNELYHNLGRERFITLFPMLRTDNGSEFTDPLSIEFDMNMSRRTCVFYCDPYASWQKPGCELNHEFIRRILPKGTSFDNLLQEDVDLMINHINSYARKSLNDKPPYDLFVSLFGKECADKLGLVLIPPDDITLKPSLLKKRF